MAKALSVLLAFSLLFIASPAVYASAPSTPDASTDGHTVVYQNSMSEDELLAEHMRQIFEQLEALDLSPSEFAISMDHGDSIMPLNDIDDYKTEYSPAMTVYAEGFAGNQPVGGIRFPTGGGFYYSEDGGPEVSVSVNFSLPFETVSVNIGLGVVVNQNTSGVYVSVPETTGFYKCKSLKEYQVVQYIIYHKYWNEATWSYEWGEWSGGVTKVHMSTTTWAERVS